MSKDNDPDSVALRKKRADYMRERGRRLGAVPVKGTEFVCQDCSKTFPKVDVKQKRCKSCRAEFLFNYSKARRLKVGHEPIGTSKKCKNCETEFTKEFKRHFYCEPCAKLSAREHLPHQIEATRKRVAKFQRERRRNIPKWGISARMSAGIKSSLRDGKNGRSWESLVGYTVSDLMWCLESQFLPDMTWDNRGKWHIDHRRPLASFSFDSADDPEFKAAWALTNLQPLWASDNLRKSAKYKDTSHDQNESPAVRQYGSGGGEGSSRA